MKDDTEDRTSGRDGRVEREKDMLRAQRGLRVSVIWGEVEKARQAGRVVEEPATNRFYVYSVAPQGITGAPPHQAPPPLHMRCSQPRLLLLLAWHSLLSFATGLSAPL